MLMQSTVVLRFPIKACNQCQAGSKMALLRLRNHSVSVCLTSAWHLAAVLLRGMQLATERLWLQRHLFLFSMVVYFE